MIALKRFVSVVVMVYLLLALLFLLVPAVRNQIADLGTALSEVERERDFFQILATIGASILAVHLVVENLDSSLLRRNVAKQDGRINELKARLYDRQPLATGPQGAPANRYGTPTAPSAPQSPMFPQHDPSLPNTPSAERPQL